MIYDNNDLMTNAKNIIAGNSDVILVDLIETCAEMLIENGVCSREAFNSKLNKKLLKDFGEKDFVIIKKASALMKRGVKS